MQKKGFTLAELLIVMTVIGAILIFIMPNIRTEKFDEKANQARAYKAYNILDQAFLNIIQQEPELCPQGSFIINNSLSLFKKGQIETFAEYKASDLRELLGKYLKYEDSDINFSELYSEPETTLSTKDEDDDDDSEDLGKDEIIGAKLMDGMYIGFEIFEEIKDCSKYYMPDAELTKDKIPEKIEAPTVFKDSTKTVDKCWGRIYIDTNGEQEPNEQGRDIFIFGLNSAGIAR